MRELLFRGQTRRKGEKVRMDGTPVESNWVYGGVFQGPNHSVIYGYDPVEKHAVYSDTVGQYTGLMDKNGQRIFEGDVVHMKGGCVSGFGAVEFRNGSFGIADEKRKRFYFLDDHSVYRVDGNIHDNPELLKEANHA